MSDRSECSCLPQASAIKAITSIHRGGRYLLFDIHYLIFPYYLAIVLFTNTMKKILLINLRNGFLALSILFIANATYSQTPMPNTDIYIIPLKIAGEVYTLANLKTSPSGRDTITSLHSCRTAPNCFSLPSRKYRK